MDPNGSTGELRPGVEFRIGETARKFPEFLSRFLSHVEPSSDPQCSCWIWVGCHDAKGYANVVVPHGFPGAGRSRRMKAHRASITLFTDEVLGGREGHHCCPCTCHDEHGVRDCVRFDHIAGKARREHMAEHRPGSAWAQALAEHEAREEMIL